MLKEVVIPCAQSECHPPPPPQLWAASVRGIDRNKMYIRESGELSQGIREVSLCAREAMVALSQILARSAPLQYVKKCTAFAEHTQCGVNFRRGWRAQRTARVKIRSPRMGWHSHNEYLELQ
jgi:hypothetical protein